MRGCLASFLSAVLCRPVSLSFPSFGARVFRLPIFHNPASLIGVYSIRHQKNVKERAPLTTASVAFGGRWPPCLPSFSIKNQELRGGIREPDGGQWWESQRQAVRKALPGYRFTLHPARITDIAAAIVRG